MARVGRALPLIARSSHVDLHSLPAMQAAYATVRPHPDYLDSLVQESVTPETLVLTWGTLEDSHRVASRVRAQFMRAGAEAVAELPGRFAALIAEPRTGQVWLVSSLLTHTHLHYAVSGAEFWVSPHDLCLVAGGQSRGTPKPSRCVAALLGSPCNRSLLENVHRTSAQRIVSWRQDQGLRYQRLASFSMTERVPLRKRHRALEQRVAVEAAVADRLKALVPDSSDTVDVEVDAGPYGLACWALATGLRSKLPLAVLSRAGDAAGEAIAQRAARTQGVGHARVTYAPRSAAAFERDSRLLAFFCNGQGSAKHLLQAECRVTRTRAVRLSSDAASLYSSEIYTSASADWPLPAQPSALAEGFLRGPARALAAPSPYASAVHAELTEALAALTCWSQDPYDLLNLAQVFLRLGRSDALGQLPWLQTQSPFESVFALKLAFQFSAPIGVQCDLPQRLVRKHLPRSLQPPRWGRRGTPWGLNLPSARWLAPPLAGLLGARKRAQVHDALDSEFLRGLATDFAPCVESLLSDGQLLLQGWLGPETAAAMRAGIASKNREKSIRGDSLPSSGPQRALLARAVTLLQWCRLCSEVSPP